MLPGGLRIPDKLGLRASTRSWNQQRLDDVMCRRTMHTPAAVQVPRRVQPNLKW